MITSSSARVRPAFLACAALSAALLLIPGAASAGGHGGGRGGHGGGGGGSRAGGGVSRGSGSHISRPSSRGGVAHNGGAFRGDRHRGGGHRGGRHGGGFHPRVGWGYYPYSSWGWGWWPYSSWWWGGPSVYVVAGGDSDGEGEGSVGVAARTGRYAIVKTDISPEEAQIFLDGKYIGSADDFDGRPDFLYLGPGKYHVEFRLPNYEAFATDLDVTRGQRVRLDQKLKLESGKSALDQFAPESKGTPLGRVFTKGGPEETEEAAPAPPRRHAARRDSRDDGWSDRGMAPAPRERIPEERVDVRDEPLPRPAGNRARMKFKVTPADAAVYVDDKYLGAGEDLAANPRGVVTDPGTHSITVTRPGYKTKTVDITVRVGAPVDVVVELEK